MTDDNIDAPNGETVEVSTTNEDHPLVMLVYIMVEFFALAARVAIFVAVWGLILGTLAFLLIGVIMLFLEHGSGSWLAWVAGVSCTVIGWSVFVWACIKLPGKAYREEVAHREFIGWWLYTHRRMVAPLTSRLYPKLLDWFEFEPF